MKGYVDPSIVPGSRLERDILAAIVQQRLTLRRERPGGHVLRLTGPDLDVITTSVRALQIEVLGPGAPKVKR
jgi:hypothetical protein